MALSRNSILCFLIAVFLFPAQRAWADDAADGDAAFNKGDFATAVKLLMPLAQKGDVTGEMDIGLMYFSGSGLPRDRAEAAKWFKAAAQHGNKGAQHDIGVAYAAGEGITKDYIQGYMWFSVAGSKPDLDHVASEMTPDQIQRAQDFAKRCQASNYQDCGPRPMEMRDENLSLCNGSDALSVINGCTALIESGKEPDDTLSLAFYNRGGAYLSVHDYNHAIENYDQAILINPGYTSAFSNRGAAYEAKHDYARAIQDFDQVIKLDPNNAVGFINRGVTKRESGDVPGGNADVVRARQIDPNAGK